MKETLPDIDIVLSPSQTPEPDSFAALKDLPENIFYQFQAARHGIKYPALFGALPVNEHGKMQDFRFNSLVATHPMMRESLKDQLDYVGKHGVNSFKVYDYVWPYVGGRWAHIYRVTSDNETTYPITEASVAESQAHPSGNKIHVIHECCGYNSAAKVSSVPAEDGTTKTINAIKFTPETNANKTFAIRYTVNTPVVSSYSAGSVLAAGTSLEGYYRDIFENASGTATESTTYYEKGQVVIGKVLSAGTSLDGYYTDSECNTACTTGTTADGSTTYYIKVDKYTEVTSELTVGTTDVSSYYIINGKEACGDAEWANGVNMYYTPTYSTTPGYAYKVIRVIP